MQTSRTSQWSARTCRTGSRPLGLTSGVVGIVRGYAWIDNSATPIGVPTIVNNGYQFNDGLGAVTVNRSATGTYTVAFAGLNIGTGHVQVTGAGGSAVWCKVQNWASSAAIVLCFNSAGAATDSTFNIAMIDSSHVIVMPPSTASVWPVM